MGKIGPRPNAREDDYQFDQIINTDNNNMDNIVEKLELIYTSVNWPFVNASLGTVFKPT